MDIEGELITFFWVFFKLLGLKDTTMSILVTEPIHIKELVIPPNDIRSYL